MEIVLTCIDAIFFVVALIILANFKNKLSILEKELEDNINTFVIKDYDTLSKRVGLLEVELSKPIYQIGTVVYYMEGEKEFKGKIIFIKEVGFNPVYIVEYRKNQFVITQSQITAWE